MYLVHSQINPESFPSGSFKPVAKSLSIPHLNAHFLSLEARIMVIERYLYRFNQIENLRMKMIKIA